jgi:hypothetical protein
MIRTFSLLNLLHSAFFCGGVKNKMSNFESVQGGGGLLFLRHISEKGNNTCIVCIEVDIRKKLKA